MPLLRTYTQPAELFAAGAQLAAHTQPALQTGLMAPALHLLYVSRRVILDLTCFALTASSCGWFPSVFRVLLGQ